MVLNLLNLGRTDLFIIDQLAYPRAHLYTSVIFVCLLSSCEFYMFLVILFRMYADWFSSLLRNTSFSIIFPIY